MQQKERTKALALQPKSCAGITKSITPARGLVQWWTNVQSFRPIFLSSQKGRIPTKRENKEIRAKVNYYWFSLNI